MHKFRIGCLARRLAGGEKLSLATITRLRESRKAGTHDLLSKGIRSLGTFLA